MQGTLGRMVLGFIAAAIAVVTVHQLIIYVLALTGLIRAAAWSLQSVPPWGVPRLVNGMFWGGLWGALFALLYERLPGGTAWLKGLIYGLLIVVVSNWILLPLIKGQIFGQPNQVLFGGWNPLRMLATVLILGGFGITLGVIYRLMASRNSN